MTARNCGGKISIAALILCQGALCCMIGCGARDVAHDRAGAIARARSYVGDLQENFRIPGLAVAVAMDDSIVWAEGFGHADLERRIPATRQTVFRIGSVSKVLTAGAVARLYEQGQLDLDAPVQDYVPEFPQKSHVITTRLLAGHLSGIRHYALDEEEDKPHYNDVISALELFKDDPLEHPPGEKHSYSSYGWNLISAVVARASGQPFLQYMREQIFEPLDMSHTGPDTIDSALPNRAVFYDGNRVAPEIDVSYKWASGGFLSTAEDLARYGSAYLLGTNFLRPETLEVVFTDQTTSDGTTVPHGIGWLVTRFENGKPLYYHPGSMTGGQAVLVIQPDDRIVVAMLANRSGGFGELAANRIACFFLGLEDDDCPEVEGARKLRIEKMERVQMLQAVLQAWKASLEAGELGALMAIYSATFQSARWEDKLALRRYLEKTLAAGTTAINIEDLHLRFRSRGFPIGSIVIVEGIKATGALGARAVRLTIIRDESGPLITDMEFLEPEI